MDTDTSTIWYSCSYCKAVFRSRNLLQNHKKAEHPDRLKTHVNSQPKKSKNSTVSPSVIQAVNKEISNQNNNINNNNITTSRLQQNGYQDIPFNSPAPSSSYRYSQQQQQHHQPMPNIYREFPSSTFTSNSIPTSSFTSANVQETSNIIRFNHHNNKGASNNLNLSTSSNNGSYSNNHHHNNIKSSDNKYDSNHYKANDTTTISNNYNQYKTDSTHMAEPSMVSKKRKVIVETVPTIMKDKIDINVVDWRNSLPLQQKKLKIENGGNTNESQLNTASKSKNSNNNNQNNNKTSANMDFDMDMNVDVKYEEYLYCDRCCNQKFVTVEQLSEHYRMCDYPEKSTHKIKSYQQQQQQHHHEQQQQQQQQQPSNSTGRYQHPNFTSPLQSYSSPSLSSFSSSSPSLPGSSSSSPYVNLKLNLSNDSREDEPTVDPLSIPASISNYSPSVIIPPTQNSSYFLPNSTSRTTTRPSITSSLSTTSTRIAPAPTAKIPCLYCGRLFQFEREAKIHELSHINNLSIPGDMSQTIFPGLYTSSTPTVIIPTSIPATPLNPFQSLNSTHPLSLPSQILTSPQHPPSLSASHFLLQQPTPPPPLLWTHPGLILNDSLSSINPPTSQPLYTPSTLPDSISSDFNYFPRVHYPNPGIPINLLPTTSNSSTIIPNTNITPLTMPNGTKNMSKNKNNSSSSNNNNSSNNSYNNYIQTSPSPYIPISTSGQSSQLITKTPVTINNTKPTEYYPKRNRTKNLLPKIPNNVNKIPQVSSINLQNKNNAQLSTGLIHADDSNDSIKSSSSSHSSNTNVNVQMPSIPISVIPTKYAASNIRNVDQQPQKTTTPPKRNRTKNSMSNNSNNNNSRNNTTGNNNNNNNKGYQNQSFNSSVHINSSAQQSIKSDNDDIIYLSTTNNNNPTPMNVSNNNNNPMPTNVSNNNNNNTMTSGITIKCNSGSIPHFTVFVPTTVITPQVPVSTTISNSSNSNNNNNRTTSGVRLNNSNSNNENDEDDLIIDVTNASPPPSSSSSQPQFNCSSCSKSYSSEKALETHTTSVHRREKPFQCPDCPKKFSHVKQLEFHALSHPSKSEKCKHCSSAFWSKTNLKEHLKEFHKNLGYTHDDDDDDDDDIDEEGELYIKIK